MGDIGVGLFNDPNDPGGCVEMLLAGGCLVFVAFAVGVVIALVKTLA